MPGASAGCCGCAAACCSRVTRCFDCVAARFNLFVNRRFRSLGRSVASHENTWIVCVLLFVALTSGLSGQATFESSSEVLYTPADAPGVSERKTWEAAWGKPSTRTAQLLIFSADGANMMSSARIEDLFQLTHDIKLLDVAKKDWEVTLTFDELEYLNNVVKPRNVHEEIPTRAELGKMTINEVITAATVIGLTNSQFSSSFEEAGEVKGQMMDTFMRFRRRPVPRSRCVRYPMPPHQRSPPVQQPCMEDTPLALWGLPSDTRKVRGVESEFRADAQWGQTVSSPNATACTSAASPAPQVCAPLRPGFPQLLGDLHVGGARWSRDFSHSYLPGDAGNVTRFAGVQLRFHLIGDPKDDESPIAEWEQAFLDKLESRQSWIQQGRRYSIHRLTERSWPDEIERASVEGHLVILCVIIMILYALYVTSRVAHNGCKVFKGTPLDRSRNQWLLGIICVICLVLSIPPAFGFAALFGIPMTSLVMINIFLVLSIGIDDMFIIVDTFNIVLHETIDDPDGVWYGADLSDTRVKDCLVKGLVEETLYRSGSSILMTTTTNFVVFIIGITCSFPGIQYFCMYAAFCIFFSFLFVVTLFMAFFTKDVRRQLSLRATCWPCTCPPWVFTSAPSLRHFAVGEQVAFIRGVPLRKGAASAPTDDAATLGDWAQRGEQGRVVAVPSSEEQEQEGYDGPVATVLLNGVLVDVWPGMVAPVRFRVGQRVATQRPLDFDGGARLAAGVTGSVVQVPSDHGSGGVAGDARTVAEVAVEHSEWRARTVQRRVIGGEAVTEQELRRKSNVWEALWESAERVDAEERVPFDKAEEGTEVRLLPPGADLLHDQPCFGRVTQKTGGDATVQWHTLSAACTTPGAVRRTATVGREWWDGDGGAVRAERRKQVILFDALPGMLVECERALQQKLDVLDASHALGVIDDETCRQRVVETQQRYFAEQRSARDTQCRTRRAVATPAGIDAERVKEVFRAAAAEGRCDAPGYIAVAQVPGALRELGLRPPPEDEITADDSGVPFHDFERIVARQAVEQESCFQAFVRRCYSRVLPKWYFKLFVILAFAALAGIMMCGLLEMKVGLDNFDMLLDDSYIKSFYAQYEKSFTPRGVPPSQMYLHTGALDYTDPAVRQALASVVARIKKEAVGSLDTAYDGGVPAWDNWLEQFCAFLTLRGESCGVSGAAAAQLLQEFPVWPVNDSYPFLHMENNTKFSDGNIPAPNGTMVASRISIFPKSYSLADWGEQLENSGLLLKQIRNILKDGEFSSIADKVFVYSTTPPQIFLDGWLVQMPVLLESLATASIACLFVTIIFLGDPRTSFFVFLMSVLMDIEMLGLLHFWGERLNSITMNGMILGVGFAVDYNAHMAHVFMHNRGNRNERAIAALDELGFSIFNGGMSTLAGFSVLALSRTATGFAMFKLFFGIVVFGLAHGLVLLPVLLSIMGPSNEEAPAEDGAEDAPDAEQQATAATEPGQHGDMTGVPEDGGRWTGADVATRTGDKPTGPFFG